MAAFFFDTSALVKRYLNETGSAWVVSITDPSAGNTIIIARIASVELVAAITRQARSGNITPAHAAASLASFRHDLGRQYRRVAITPKLLTRAMLLAEGHALRGYDAVQLAAALLANAQRQRRRNTPLTLVAADTELNAAAVTEGLAVEDPNAHP